jgi:uncharacterized OB-fold protein
MQAVPPKPLPDPSDLTRPFWDACRRHELSIQRCRSCGALLHYPKVICPHDQGTEFDWAPMSGRGTVHSYVGAYRAFHPAFQDDLPYTIAIVELEEGPRMMTNIVAPPDSVSIGMKVEVLFEDVTDTIALPKFRPAGEA